jgi:hypothetical protein
VFSSVTDISFAAGSNNISYNSINKKLRFLSTSLLRVVLLHKIPVRESVWWRGCAYGSIPGFGIL